MRRSVCPGILAVSVAAALLGAACAGADDPTVGNSGAGGGNGGPQAGATGSGKASLLPSTPTVLPTFTLDQFNALIQQLRGTPVVVNVWASWCGPCQAEAPDLATVARKFEGKAQFLGVDIQDQREPARAFVKRFRWPYPSVFDPAGAIRDGLGFVGQPVTAIYDRSGQSVFVWSGPITKDLLETELSTVVSS